MEVDGTIVSSSQEMVNAMASKKAGDTVEIKYFRMEGDESKWESYDDIQGDFHTVTVELAMAGRNSLLIMTERIRPGACLERDGLRAFCDAFGRMKRSTPAAPSEFRPDKCRRHSGRRWAYGPSAQSQRADTDPAPGRCR